MEFEWIKDFMKAGHVWQALSCKIRRREEGGVGGGTGMIAMIKGGDGTSARVIDKSLGGYGSAGWYRQIMVAGPHWLLPESSSRKEREDTYLYF